MTEKTARMGARLMALALAAAPVAAQAQAWIGQVVGNMMAQQAAAAQEAACRAGTPMVDKEVAEARDPAPAVMQAYWAAASEHRSPAAQFVTGKSVKWSNGVTVLGEAQLGTIADPFAATGNRLEPVPLGFVRAGDAGSALGQWRVTDASGAKVGIYQALFRRKNGQWLLSSLELFGRYDWVDPVVQYCHNPADVLPARVESAKANKEWTRHQLEKGTEREARFKARLGKAEADLAKSPGSNQKREAARLARQDWADKARELAERRQADEAATTELAAAEQALAEFEASRTAGKAALLAEAQAAGTK